MQPTLLILAAGMGSRYGALKQIEPFGPNGETLMDYSLYDALQAGFERAVFVIRRDFEASFLETFGRRYEKHVHVEYLFQELSDLPSGFSTPFERQKPWGTAHAIWTARTMIKEPFASINADDYYGKTTFKLVAQHLTRPSAEMRMPEYCMAGFRIDQTLSEHGAVARGICEVDGQGFLKGVTERTGVEKSEGTAKFMDETGCVRILKGDEIVSMNIWGFQPAVFDQLARHFTKFLKVHNRTRDTSEFYIPAAVDNIIKEKAARVRVLPTPDSWFGVTYQEDKTRVVAALRGMVERGEYPSPLWG
jgi:UTP-glucose-1-phosphate uridylyltransferase